MYTEYFLFVAILFDQIESKKQIVIIKLFFFENLCSAKQNATNKKQNVI